MSRRRSALGARLLLVRHLAVERSSRRGRAVAPSTRPRPRRREWARARPSPRCCAEPPSNRETHVAARRAVRLTSGRCPGPQLRSVVRPRKHAVTTDRRDGRVGAAGRRGRRAGASGGWGGQWNASPLSLPRSHRWPSLPRPASPSRRCSVATAGDALGPRSEHPTAASTTSWRRVTAPPTTSPRVTRTATSSSTSTRPAASTGRWAAAWPCRWASARAPRRACATARRCA